MSEPKERGTWPLTDEAQELLDRCLADVRRELIEQAQREAEYLSRSRCRERGPAEPCTRLSLMHPAL